MTTWTYKAVFLAPTPVDRKSLETWLGEMNAYGAEGWEAFSIIPRENGWWTIFRRRSNQETAQDSSIQGKVGGEEDVERGTERL